MKTAIAALAAAVLLTATPTSAAVIDQSSLGTDVGLNGIYEWQQQVTAGVNGQLSAVTLWAIGTLTVRITPGAGYYSGPYLFTQTLTFDFADGFNGTRIDTSAANIFLKAGDQFVIDFIPAGDAFAGQGASSQAYAGGDLFLNSPLQGIFNYTDAHGTSLRFETFMDNSAVPEPATWGLMLAGFVGVGSALRWKRRYPVHA